MTSVTIYWTQIILIETAFNFCPEDLINEMIMLIQVMACQNISQNGQQKFNQRCYAKMYFLMTLFTMNSSIPVSLYPCY